MLFYNLVKNHDCLYFSIYAVHNDICLPHEILFAISRKLVLYLKDYILPDFN